MKAHCATEDALKAFGASLGQSCQGGEVFELVGDVGAGKTTLTKGLADGLMVEDDVQSPSFTLSRVYTARDGLELHHYDFYRLHDPGIMRYELAESVKNPHVVTVVEWAETVRDVLPMHRKRITIAYTQGGDGRDITAEGIP